MWAIRYQEAGNAAPGKVDVYNPKKFAGPQDDGLHRRCRARTPA
jgi:hypothetical protein